MGLPFLLPLQNFKLYFLPILSKFNQTAPLFSPVASSTDTNEAS